MSGSVLVLHTGGTIGMVGSPDGQTTVAGALGPYLDWIVESSRGDLPPIAFLELDPLIDSANATPDEWCDIARTLYEHRTDHTGFVVLHGTDTMAYTSSALSFLLPNFGRPVVVTGYDFTVRGSHFLCDIEKPKCTTKPEHKGKEGDGPGNLSPDGKREAFIRDWNLWVRDLATGKETQLTTDGVKDFGYATNNAGWVHDDSAILVWSPDSSKIATFQQDQRKTSTMALVGTTDLSWSQWVTGSIAGLIAYVLTLTVTGEVSRSEVSGFIDSLRARLAARQAV